MPSEIWKILTNYHLKIRQSAVNVDKIKNPAKVRLKHCGTTSMFAHRMLMLTSQSHPNEKQTNAARQQKSLQDLGFKKADASLIRQETKEELIARILLRQNIALSFVEDPGVKQIFADGEKSRKNS
jgi:hypothetical protein